MRQMGFILATKYIKRRKLLLRGTLEEHGKELEIVKNKINNA